MRKVTKEFWRKIERLGESTYDKEVVPHVFIGIGGLGGDAGIYYQYNDKYGERVTFREYWYKIFIKNPDYRSTYILEKDIKRLEELVERETEKETKEFLQQLISELQSLPEVSPAELLK